MGLQLLARVNGADYFDDFAGAAGVIAGRVMPRGGLVWGTHALDTANRPVLDGSGGLRAPAAVAGAAIAVVNPGAADAIVVAKIKALTANPIPRLVFRATDSLTHYFVSLRYNTSGSEYCIGGRSDGADAGFALRTGVAPKVGDRIRLDIHAAGSADLYVNGALLGSAVLPSFADRTHVGVWVAQGDSTTAFDDIGVYV